MVPKPILIASRESALEQAIKAAAVAAVAATRANTQVPADPPTPMQFAPVKPFESIQDTLPGGRLLQVASLLASFSSMSGEQAPAPQVLAQSPPIMHSGFERTAAFVSTLMTAPGWQGNLDACVPMLRHALRQALSECLGVDVQIQGQLTIGAPIHGNQTTLHFNDEVANSQPLTTALQFSQGESPIVTTASTLYGYDAVSLAAAVPSLNGVSSRRKSGHPTKLCPSEMAAQPLSYSPPFGAQLSGSASPSTDSGVLDLSIAGSLSGSAPITPMKSLSVTVDATTGGSSPQEFATAVANTQSFLEYCQHQLLGQQQLEAALQVATINSANVKCHVVGDQSLSASQSPRKVARRRLPVLAPRTGVMRRSSNSKQFPCNQCWKEFPSLHVLEEHTVAEHGTYRCHVCKAQFTQRSNLQRHALKHVGFKPFECRVCGKAYFRKDHLMRHMEMGHPGYSARENITVHLTSSESLDFLNRNANIWQNMDTSANSLDQQLNIVTPDVDVEMHVEDEEIRITDTTLEQEELERISLLRDSEPGEVTLTLDCMNTGSPDRSI